MMAAAVVIAAMFLGAVCGWLLASERQRRRESRKLFVRDDFDK